jgi:hypothetical protein
VLPRLPVAELAATSRADFGRPSKGLHTALGVLWMFATQARDHPVEPVDLF